MGLIQRVFDEAGLVTISITQVAEIAAIVKPSRSLFVANPFGLTFGDVGDAAGQLAVVHALLDAAQSMEAPGILDSGIKWTKNDLRYRQLRKMRG